MDAFAVGLAFVLVLLLVKEAGLPVPVPGDLLVLGLGAGAADGRFEPVVALVGAIGASVVGGIVQFVLVRGAGRRPLLALLARLGVPRDRIDALSARIRGRGAIGLAAARMTPGVRIAAVAAAGLAALPFGSFVAGLAAGNAAFIGGHFVLGAVLGTGAAGALASIGPVLLALVGLAVAG